MHVITWAVAWFAFIHALWRRGAHAKFQGDSDPIGKPPISNPLTY